MSITYKQAARIIAKHAIEGIRGNRATNGVEATRGWTGDSAVDTYLENIENIAGCEQVAAAALVVGGAHNACNLVSDWLESEEAFVEDVEWALRNSDMPELRIDHIYADTLHTAGEDHRILIAYLGEEDVGVQVEFCGSGMNCFRSIGPRNTPGRVGYGYLRDALEDAISVYLNQSA